ncbi:MAG: hypothetical protein RLZZ370_928 [Bacteroidota bacterium]|jgi:predicted short-subunit dehydrogenase-like oxidoreductase (DUF2520 family)
MTPPKTAILGSGKLATAVAQRLVAQGWPIHWIVSRNKESGQKLAEACQSQFVDASDHGHSWSAELLLLCVPDDQIAPSARMFKEHASCMIHLSGTVALDVLDCDKAAVMWPLMSFNQLLTVPWSEIPWFWEATHETATAAVHMLVKTLGGTAIQATETSRRYMHLAAVFAHNFSNACISMAQELAADAACSPDTLNPIIQNMLNQLQHQPARSLQTGPALRGDVQTMQAHLNLLQEHPEMAACYRAMSDFIRFQSKKTEKD